MQVARDKRVQNAMPLPREEKWTTNARRAARNVQSVQENTVLRRAPTRECTKGRWALTVRMAGDGEGGMGHDSLKATNSNNNNKK